MVTRDVYRQPDAPDPVLSPQAVLALVRRHVASAREVTAVDESGGEARAYMIDDGLVLKTQRPHRLRPRTSLAKEAFLLEQIAGLCDLSVPRVLGYGKDDGVEYLCLTRIAGLPARSLDAPAAVRERVASDLGRFMRRLHGLPQAAFSESALVPGDRSAAGFQERVESMTNNALTALGAQPDVWPLNATPGALVASVRQRLVGGGPLVLLHSNPGPEHTFVDASTGEMTGLIDFGDSYISHAALDLRVWPRRNEREAVLAGYGSETPLPPGFEDQWLAAMALGDLVSLALWPERRARAQENLRALAPILDL